MRRTFIVVAALSMLVFIAAPGLANNTWNGYHWADGGADPHDGVISLTLVDDLDAYGTEYSAVFADWNGSPGPLTLNPGTPGERPDACDNVATNAAGNDIVGTIHVCNDEYGQNGWLGLARIWIAPDGHIEAGVALMNDSYLFDSGSAYDNSVARRHVLCQEVGHTFGLDHQGSPKKQSCMNARWGLTNPDFQSPNAHDYDTLNEIYGIASSDGGDGDSSKPCNPNRPNCPNGANAHIAPRAGGGWIVTFTVPTGPGLR